MTKRRGDASNICSELLMLDPTARGLGPLERFSRSLKLVELTLGETISRILREFRAFLICRRPR